MQKPVQRYPITTFYSIVIYKDTMMNNRSKLKIPWLVKRLTQILIVLFGVSVLTFVFYALAPGDAVNQYAAPNVSAERLDDIRQQYGLDKSIPVQYFRWLGKSLQGNLGYSLAKHQPVADVVRTAIPATLRLTLAALCLNLILGTLWGVFAAVHANRLTGRILNIVSILFISIPVFWLSLVALYFCSLRWGWYQAFNTFSAGSTWALYINRYLLPVLILGTAGAAATCRFVRENMIAALHEPYCLQARAAGLPNQRIVRYALRNALLPLITQTGLIFPFLLGGSFIIEVIFALPGMGRITYDAIFSRDIPVILSVNMLSAALVVFGNALADILYRHIDPRISLTY
ncbi:MAG: ABC transporter permease [candidate division KSB1 bacterium]|nr:ABC transporter permease [candidate division KSB1 bacterium]